MSKRIKDLEKPRIAETFDYADVVRRRIEDCGKASANPLVFPATVQALENLIPDTDLDDKYREDKEKSEEKITRLQYTYWCGRPQGTRDRPVLINDPSDELNYNPNEPTLIKSPIEVEDIFIDWNSRFRAAFNLFVRLGVAVRRPLSAG